MHPPDIEEALAALDYELGRSARVRYVPTASRPWRRQQGRRRDSIQWARVAEWCYTYPGVAFEATVHKNAVFRFRAAYPELRVEGSNHRRDPETGRQIATLFAVYEPDAERLPLRKPPPRDRIPPARGD